MPMKPRTPLLALVLTLPALAGCIGATTSNGSDFEPGTGWEPTGNTVHLRMWVEDLTQTPVYPGFNANLWAFCAEAADPNDAYSAAAIEYREQDGILMDRNSNTRPAEGDKCSVPGPQLRVKQGDRVIVDFQNDHFHPHTIHWHGQFVPYESDGVPGSTQDSVAQGQSFRYDFIAKRAGTLWYHCHVDTQFHVMQGLYGMMIVEPQDESLEPKDIDKEYSLVLSNLVRDLVEYIPPKEGEVVDPHAAHKHGGACGASGIQGCQNPAHDLEPDVFLLNGHSFPKTVERDDTLISLAPGERVRVRILNAGPVTMETLHPHGHDFLVTHKDGNPLPINARYWVDTLTIGPGERYDVVLEGHEDREGIWVLHTHITSHVTNDGQYPGGMLTKIVYPGFVDAHSPYADGAELPGGQPYREPVVLPDDYSDDERFNFMAASGAIQGVSGDWWFDVGLKCAIRNGVHFVADLETYDPVSAQAADLTVTINDPDGALATTLQLGGDAIRDEWMPDPATLKEGNYTVAITGNAGDSVLTLRVAVDYYDSMAALEATGHSC